jgi:hypothetical protein
MFAELLALFIRNFFPLAFLAVGLWMTIMALKTPDVDEAGNDKKKQKIVFSVIGFLIIFLSLFLFYKLNRN